MGITPLSGLDARWIMMFPHIWGGLRALLGSMKTDQDLNLGPPVRPRLKRAIEGSAVRYGGASDPDAFFI
jgi:hypothetical protein